MNDQFTRQLQATLALPANIVVPADAQAIARDGVARTRAAFNAWSAVAQSGASAIREVMQVGQSGAEAVGESVLNNAKAATDAAFDAAEELARAKTIPEVAQLQAKFVQEQFVVASQQGKGLFELSAKIVQEATNTLTAVATKVERDLKVAVQ